MINIFAPGAGIPVAMAILGGLTLWAGIASWRRNAKAGLHQHDRSPTPPADAVDERTAPGAPDVAGEIDEAGAASRRIVTVAAAAVRPMGTRAAAAAFLAIAALVAWVTITIPLAARVLQLSILLSMLYVGYLAWRGARVMREALAWGRSGAAEPTGLATGLPFVSLVVPARNEAAVIGSATSTLVAQAYARGDGTPAFDVLVVDDVSTDATARCGSGRHRRGHPRAGRAPRSPGGTAHEGIGPRLRDAVPARRGDRRARRR